MTKPTFEPSLHQPGYLFRNCSFLQTPKLAPFDKAYNTMSCRPLIYASTLILHQQITLMSCRHIFFLSHYTIILFISWCICNKRISIVSHFSSYLTEFLHFHIIHLTILISLFTVCLSCRHLMYASKLILQ